MDDLTGGGSGNGKGYGGDGDARGEPLSVENADLLLDELEDSLCWSTRSSACARCWSANRR